MYSFKLKDSYTNKIIDINPYYSGAEITTELQNNRYTKTLNGNFQFIGVDFEAIIDKPITTTFYVTMYKDGVPYPDGNAKFTFNEIQVDYNKKIIDVKMLSNTLQENFNTILSNEYDLKKIDTKKTSLKYSEKVLFQLYCLGDNQCANLQHGNILYQDCSIEDNWFEGTTNFDGYFGSTNIQNPNGSGYLLKNSGTIQTSFIDAPSLPIHGAWICTDTNINSAATATVTDALPSISEIQCAWYHESGLYYAFTNLSTSGQFDYYIMKLSDNSIYANCFGGQFPVQNMFKEYVIFTKNGIDFHFEQPKVVVIRLIKPKETTSINVAYYELGKVDNDFDFTQNKYQDDIVCSYYMSPNNSRYDEITNIMYKPTFIVTSATQIQETKYGKSTNGKYFTYPTQSGTWSQIGQSVWDNYSIWFENNIYVDADIDTFTEKPYEIEAYYIKDVFNAIFANAGLQITYESSYFDTLNAFFDNTSIKPLITQVTNIKTPDGVPASVNKIRLGELLDFICQLFNLQYKITSNKIIIEHSYINDGATIDLTQNISTRSYKNVTHNQSKYKYDIQDLYRRKSIKMSEASDLLGVSEIVTDYVSINDLSIELGQFYTDFSYIINSSQIEAGYFLAITNSSNELPLQNATIKGLNVKINNKYGALPLAVAKNHPYEDLSENLLIDNTSIPVIGKKRCKIQELQISDSLTLSENYLIKTDVGVAKVNKISLSLDEKYYKLLLAHE